MVILVQLLLGLKNTPFTFQGKHQEICFSPTERPALPPTKHNQGERSIPVPRLPCFPAMLRTGALINTRGAECWEGLRPQKTDLEPLQFSLMS